MISHKYQPGGLSDPSSDHLTYKCELMGGSPVELGRGSTMLEPEDDNWFAKVIIVSSTLLIITLKDTSSDWKGWPDPFRC